MNSNLEAIAFVLLPCAAFFEVKKHVSLAHSLPGDALQHPSLREECVTPSPTTAAPETTPTPTAAPITSSSCTVDTAEYDYDEVLYKSLLFYEAQRSGYLPASQRVTWRRDSATDDALDADTNEAVNLEGGYYDGGSVVPRHHCTVSRMCSDCTSTRLWNKVISV